MLFIPLYLQGQPFNSPVTEAAVYQRNLWRYGLKLKRSVFLSAGSLLVLKKCVKLADIYCFKLEDLNKIVFKQQNKAINI